MFKRKIDLNSYLPQVIGDALEIREMNHIEDLEISGIWDASEKMFYNRWILSADDDGLKRYEKLMGLPHVGDLESRRKIAYMEWNKNIRYTDRSVRLILNKLIGPGGYSMQIEYEKYTVNFEVVLWNDAEIESINIYRELRHMIPANLWIAYSFGIYDDLIFKTQSGDYTFPYFLCGEHVTGGVPHDLYAGDPIMIDIRIHTESNVSKNRFGLPKTGYHSGELNKKDYEIIYAEDITSLNIYSFEREW